MTDSLAARNTPVLWINQYLKEKILDFTNGLVVPFFPTEPIVTGKQIGRAHV